MLDIKDLFRICAGAQLSHSPGTFAMVGDHALADCNLKNPLLN